MGPSQLVPNRGILGIDCPRLPKHFKRLGIPPGTSQGGSQLLRCKTEVWISAYCLTVIRHRLPNVSSFAPSLGELIVELRARGRNALNCRREFRDPLLQITLLL